MMSEQKDLNSKELQVRIKSMMGQLGPENIKNTVVEATQNMSDADREAIINAIRGLPPPTGATRNWIWTIVVAAFALVLVGTFVTIAIAMFTMQAKDTINMAKPELVLSMFTSVVGFLAGLFVPSPVANRPQ